MPKVSKKELQMLIQEYKTQKRVSQYLNVSEATVSRWMSEYGLADSKHIRKNTSLLVSDMEFKDVCESSQSMAEAAKKLNIPFTTFIRRAKKLNCYNTNQAGKGMSKNSPSKYSVNDEYFSHWTPQMAYWVGFIVADGSISKRDKHLLRISQASIDEYMLERFKNDLKFTGPIRRGTNTLSNGKTYPFSVVSINNEKIVQDLKNMGIVSNKTYIDFNYLEKIPLKYRKYFIVGLFDGDGTVSANQGNVGIAGNKINCLSIFKELGFSEEVLRIKDYGKYVTIYLRFKSDCFIFYQQYLSVAEEINVLERKKERIFYFYNKYLRDHPEMFS